MTKPVESRAWAPKVWWFV